MFMHTVMQYGTETEEEGVVYPGEVEVRVDLDPGDMVCSGVTADDISCTVNITRDDNYTVSLTLSNDVGSTQPVESMFDCELPVRVLSISSLHNRISIVINATCRIVFLSSNHVAIIFLLLL